MSLPTFLGVIFLLPVAIGAAGLDDTSVSGIQGQVRISYRKSYLTQENLQKVKDDADNLLMSVARDTGVDGEWHSCAAACSAMNYGGRRCALFYTPAAGDTIRECFLSAKTPGEFLPAAIPEAKKTDTDAREVRILNIVDGISE